MVSSQPDQEDLTVEFPARVTILGEALAPVSRNLRNALTLKATPSGQEFVVFFDLPRHMGLIHQALTHLTPKLDDLMDSVVHNDSATLADAHRAAGRLEQGISEFVDGYHDARSSFGTQKSANARELLIGVYRHDIREICEWLEELVQAIAKPALALVKSGVVAESGATLSVVLKMTSPPQMEKLCVLWDEMLKKSGSRAVSEPSYETDAVKSPGLLGTLGAVVFGLGVSKAIFGGKHD